MTERLSGYGIITRSRGVIMGIAILGVVIYHAKFNFDSKILKFWQYLGDSGVDMFLFLSGFGVVHSLAKNPPSVFFKNRLRKLLPVAYLYLITYGTYKLLSHTEFHFTEIMGWLTLTGFWSGLARQANWYFYLSLLLYALSPLLYSLLKDSKKPRRTALVLVAFAYLASISFWYRDQLMAVSRVPLYLLGFYIGMYWDREKPLTPKHWIGIFAACLVGLVATGLGVLFFERKFLRQYGFFWYPYVLYAPAMLLILGWFFCKFGRRGAFRLVSWVLKVCGEASLEILVTHLFLFSMATTYHWIPVDKYHSAYNWLWLALSAITVVCGCVVHAVICLVEGKLCAKQKLN